MHLCCCCSQAVEHMERLKTQKVDPPPEVAGERRPVCGVKKKITQIQLSKIGRKKKNPLFICSGRKRRTWGPRRGRPARTSGTSGSPSGPPGGATYSSGCTAAAAAGRTVEWSPGPTRRPSDAPGSATRPPAGCTRPAQPALIRLAHPNPTAPRPHHRDYCCTFHFSVLRSSLSTTTSLDPYETCRRVRMDATHCRLDQWNEELIFTFCLLLSKRNTNGDTPVPSGCQLVWGSSCRGACKPPQRD